MGHPKVSIIIPVGGKGRLANFQLVLAALLNQTMQQLEVIVLEHSPVPLYQRQLPSSVKYHHVPMADDEEEFNKSRLFNKGVERARAPIIMLHDADILVPQDYVENTFRCLEDSTEAIRPLRLLFYLTEKQTEYLRNNHKIQPGLDIELVAQNSRGGSVMLRKETYQQIGGHDERFTGWGGEDQEFLERLQTRKLFRGGLLPALHLWHPVAQKKANRDGNLGLLAELRKIEPARRVKLLNAHNTSNAQTRRQVS
jgi:predicted glycosyltransferase involved in capsule biosynthesis